MTQTLVNELMSRDPYTLDSESTLAQLYDLMETKNVRHIPVVDEGNRLLGMVSHRDLIRNSVFSERELPLSARRELLEDFKVTEIMTPDPQTTGPDDDIREAGLLMYENKFGCLPVVEGDELVGILTESDFVRYVIDNAGE